MRFYKYLAGFGLALALVACGGGGGSAGTPTGESDSTGNGGTSIVGTAETLLSAQLKDSVTGATVNSVAAGGSTEIVATLITKDGQGVPGQVVYLGSTVFTDLLFFPNGTSAKTDSNGVARIKVSRANLYEFGIATFFLQFESTDKYAFSLSETITYRVDPPVLKVDLVDGGIATTAISSSGTTSVKATLRFSDGTPVTQKRIEIAADLTKVSFPEGSSELTGPDGVAIIKITRASSSVGGAGTLNAAATISGTNTNGSLESTVVTGVVDYSLGAVIGAATLSLDTFDVGAATMAAYGTRQLSVRAMLGTSVKSSVQVTFSSNCGQISPATVLTNSNGVAVTSFTATDLAGTSISTLGCSEKTVDFSASAVGATEVTKSINVAAAPATNLSFVVPVDPVKSRIYLANSGGLTQTNIDFLLSNAKGEPIPGQDVDLTLKTLNETSGGGIPKATFGTVGNISKVTRTTDSLGKVSVPVFSGTIPTNVLVNAALVSNPAVQSDSSVVVIASGRPAQARVSMSTGKTAIRGMNFDGETTTITMALADRQGNPVPDGTAVNFVTEGGVMIPPTCVTGWVAGDSRCTVNIRTQNPRPANGLVSILAYASGEEDFDDANFNNVFDCGETFSDLVTAYRDDTATTSGVFAPFVAGEFSVPRSASSSSCRAGTTPSPTAGDGVWGAADVRGQILVVFSTDDFVVTSPQWFGANDPNWNNGFVTTQLNVTIQDLNGRSVPTGSTIGVAVTDNSPKFPADGVAPDDQFGQCSLISQSHTAVPDSLGPLVLTLDLKQCATGDQITVTVNTAAIKKAITFTAP